MKTPQIAGFVLSLLLTAHLILLGFFQISSEDTWWHLKQGELYVTTHSLPPQDPFAFTTSGHEWIKYSWLADILFYLTYRAAGFSGLILLRLGVLLLIAFLLYRVFRGCNLHPLAAILLVFLASLALRFRLYVRPELLSFLLLLLSMTVLLRLRDARPFAAYGLLPVQFIWTNVHASFVFGFALPGLVLLANLLPGTWAVPGWGRLSLDRFRLKHLVIASACLPLVALLNPHGVSMLLFPLRQNTMTGLVTFAEWAEVWVLPEIDPVWWEVIVVLAVVLLAFFVTALLLMVWEGRVDPVGWGIVLCMGCYAIFRNRAVPYFILAVLPLLALALIRVAAHLPARLSGGYLRRLERIGAFACIVVLSGSIVDQAFLTSRNPIGFGVRPHYFPEGAAAFLDRSHLDGRVFNTYEFGGYLIWRRWPANQVFIDGRYDRILFDERMIAAYDEAHRSPVVLDRIAATYNVEILVLDANPARRMPHIGQDPRWVRVYWDPVAEVYVRRGGRFADVIEAHEYRLTRSETNLAYLAAYRRNPDTWAQALIELRRAVVDNPENELAWQGLAQEYGAAGASALEQRLEALTRATNILAGMRATGILHGERADALLQLGRMEEAKVAAQAALRLDGDLLPPRYVLAAVAERRRDWAGAREQLRAILGFLHPDDPEAGIVRQRMKMAERNAYGESSE